MLADGGESGAGRWWLAGWPARPRPGRVRAVPPWPPELLLRLLTTTTTTAADGLVIGRVASFIGPSGGRRRERKSRTGLVLLLNRTNDLQAVVVRMHGRSTNRRICAEARRASGFRLPTPLGALAESYIQKIDAARTRTSLDRARTSPRPRVASMNMGDAPGCSGSGDARASAPTRPNQSAAPPDAWSADASSTARLSSTATSSAILVATSAIESSAVFNPFREASRGLTFRSSS
jgi:hypothetical protein